MQAVWRLGMSKRVHSIASCSDTETQAQRAKAVRWIACASEKVCMCRRPDIDKLAQIFAPPPRRAQIVFLRRPTDSAILHIDQGAGEGW